MDDFNQDGNLDVAISGNDYGNEVTNGRYDAMNGLLLQGDGTGNFAPQTILQSGLYIPGDAKVLVKLRQGTNGYLLAGSQNQNALKVFRLKTSQKVIPIKPFDRYAIIHLQNGKKRRQELYYGNSFLSQSARFLNVSASDSVEIGK